MLAVDRYIKDFNRVRICYEDGKDNDFISLATDLINVLLMNTLKLLKIVKIILDLPNGITSGGLARRLCGRLARRYSGGLARRLCGGLAC